MSLQRKRNQIRVNKTFKSSLQPVTSQLADGPTRRRQLADV